MRLRPARKRHRNSAGKPASESASRLARTLALTLSLCAGAATAIAPAAVAAQPTSFLIDSVSGPVTYPVCAPLLTWSAALPADWSAAEQEREAAQWRQAFAELTALTDYTFAELPAGEPLTTATITIDYSLDPQPAAAPLGSGGIEDFAWDGSRWVASRSEITMQAAALQRWQRSLGSTDIHAWVIRHELAHALGLGHREEPGHLMAPQFTPGVSPTRFHAEDLADLTSIERIDCPQ